MSGPVLTVVGSGLYLPHPAIVLPLHLGVQSSLLNVISSGLYLLHLAIVFSPHLDVHPSHLDGGSFASI